MAASVLQKVLNLKGGRREVRTACFAHASDRVPGGADVGGVLCFGESWVVGG